MELCGRMVPGAAPVYVPVKAAGWGLVNERDRIMCAAPGRLCEMPKGLLVRILQIGEKLHRKVGRNDPCPCQSGLKYGKCCGRS